ncbi:MAG: hypothetical protein ACRYG6_04835 [Janthinobacterium lividum]
MSYADLDAELVRLCREAIACEARSEALTMAVNDVVLSDPRWTAAFAEARLLMDRYNQVLDQVEQIAARTPAGLRAKTELVRVHMHPDQDEFGVVHSLLRDVLAYSTPPDLVEVLPTRV